MITVDVGNTTIGIGRWAGGRPNLTVVATPEEAAAQIDGSALAISVAPARLERLLDALGPRRADLATLVRPPRMDAAPSLVASAGADRVANVLAMRAGPGVVVDCGTAVTVDIVDGSSRWLGGYIAPGPRAGAGALSTATESLPSIEADEASMEPGLETTTAMAAGLWGMAVGGVDRLVQEARQCLEHSPSPRIVATGGWGAAWAAVSRHSGVEVDDAHVHHGIARWAELAGEL